MIKHVDLMFHRASEELPPQSGHYIVLTDTNNIMELEYSKVHQLFNASDRTDYTEAERTHIEVLAWAHPGYLREKLNRWRDNTNE